MPRDVSAGGSQVLHVPDHLFRCLVITVLSPPTGWLALRHAWKVNHHLAEGDEAGARQARVHALRWYWVSAGLLLFVYLPLITLGMFFRVFNSHDLPF